MGISVKLVTILTAELTFLLMRRQDIEILVKKKAQRVEREQYQVDRGLLRSVILEGLLFVPASATLMLFFVPAFVAWLEGIMTKFSELPVIVHAGMGMLSYQFPFASFQSLITNRALKVLDKYSRLAPADILQSELKEIEHHEPRPNKPHQSQSQPQLGDAG